MNSNIAIFASLIAVLTAFYLVNKPKERENFEATGLVYNQPPEWFRKPAYNANDWIVAYYPQQISQPSCMYQSRGNPRELNYLSSAYRFWRM